MIGVVYINHNLTSYHLTQGILDRISKSLSINRKKLSNIIQDHNIFYSNGKFYMNYKEISESKVIDIILDVRFNY